jgi:hypothetical protein
VTLTAADADQGDLVCRGGLYKNPYTGQRHRGNLVFIYAGQAPVAGSGGADEPRGHKGWNDFAKAMSKNVPTHLQRARMIRLHTLRKMGAPRNLGGG